MRRVVLATRNGHKVRELQTILADLLEELDLEIVGMGEFPDIAIVVETGVTFTENAALKAVAVAEVTGLPALADDSGLAVDVLGGAPGVFSARWAGTHGQDRANIELLLGQLADVPDRYRGAAFVCAAVLALPDGTVRVREGRMGGTLAREPRGDNGFGYDPILVVEGDSRTSAELSFEEKNAISHRGEAFRALTADLRELLADK
jgi:XTP/dITP diphosphohydrolase